MHAPKIERDSGESECIALRRILNLPSSFINRSWLNAAVLNEANRHRVGNKPMQTVSDTSKKRRLRLLDHLFRAPNRDPMRGIVLSCRNSIITPAVRRPGRSRKHWMFETKDAGVFFHLLNPAFTCSDASSPPMRPSLRVGVFAPS